MITTRQIRKKYGGNVCRYCMSDILRETLYPRHCKYEKERGMCPCCKYPRKHLVRGFTLSGLMKTIGKAPVGVPITGTPPKD